MKNMIISIMYLSKVIAGLWEDKLPKDKIKFIPVIIAWTFQRWEYIYTYVEQGCMAVEGQQIKIPSEDEAMKFQNHFQQLKAPFVVYVDWMFDPEI